MFFLVCIKGPLEGKRLAIPAAPCVRLGRQDDNHLVIDNARVSRHHLEFLNRGQKIYLRDLGSQNGTYLQQKKIPSGSGMAIELQVADEIGIGECLFRLESAANNGQPKNPSNDTLAGEASCDNTPSRHLEIMQAAFKALCAAENFSDFYQAMGDLALRMLGADRLCLMTFDPQEKTLVPQIFQNTITRGNEARFEPSMMILHEVLNHKKTIFSIDAGADARFSEGQSIVNPGVRSVLCSPLLVGNGLIGALYADTLQSKHTFSPREKDAVELITQIIVQGQDRFALR